jgi:hypothetical protein
MDLEKLTEAMHIPVAVYDYIYTNATHGGMCFCRYLQLYEGELIFRAFGYRKLKRKGVQIMEVERAVVGNEYAKRKNLYKTQMGGYHAVFEESQKSSSNWYGYTYYYFSPDDFEKWYTEKYAGFYAPVINLEFIYTLDEYKYCGYSGNQELKQYLDYYKKDHAVEYFGKAGLRYTVMLGKKAKKDRAFAKFIIENARKVNIYGYQITWCAYQNKCSFVQAEDIVCEKRRADAFFRGLNDAGYKVDRVKLYSYAKTMISKWNFEAMYRDYWNACIALGLDMNDTKNSMPFDFHRMHDIRIAEYASLKAKEDRKKAQAMNRKIKQTAKKYELDVNSRKYTVILPTKQSDFVREGKALHHCVGEMGYDKKMADGKIVIMFVRLKEDPTKSFVTVEYDLTKQKVVQEYGNHNKRPDKNTLAFIEKWEKKMREVQKSETKVV